jgi:hypothetical protein
LFNDGEGSNKGGFGGGAGEIKNLSNRPRNGAGAPSSGESNRTTTRIKSKECVGAADAGGSPSDNHKGSNECGHGGAILDDI